MPTGKLFEVWETIWIGDVADQTSHATFIVLAVILHEFDRRDWPKDIPMNAVSIQKIAHVSPKTYRYAKSEISRLGICSFNTVRGSSEMQVTFELELPSSSKRRGTIPLLNQVQDEQRRGIIPLLDNPESGSNHQENDKVGGTIPLLSEPSRTRVPGKEPGGVVKEGEGCTGNKKELRSKKDARNVSEYLESLSDIHDAVSDIVSKSQSEPWLPLHVDVARKFWDDIRLSKRGNRIMRKAVADWTRKVILGHSDPRLITLGMLRFLNDPTHGDKSPNYVGSSKATTGIIGGIVDSLEMKNSPELAALWKTEYEKMTGVSPVGAATRHVPQRLDSRFSPVGGTPLQTMSLDQLIENGMHMEDIVDLHIGMTPEQLQAADVPQDHIEMIIRRQKETSDGELRRAGCTEDYIGKIHG